MTEVVTGLVNCFAKCNCSYMCNDIVFYNNYLNAMPVPLGTISVSCIKSVHMFILLHAIEG